jgi:hypothetical protein
MSPRTGAGSDGGGDRTFQVSDQHLHDELETLRQQNLLLAEENARLREMLGSAEPETTVAAPAFLAPDSVITASSSAATKIELFRRLFGGRGDVYAKRWQSRSGASGYAPACANEWRSGLCDKRRVKCADCANRELLTLSASIIEEHLTGRITVGVYRRSRMPCRSVAFRRWRPRVVLLRRAGARGFGAASGHGAADAGGARKARPVASLM